MTTEEYDKELNFLQNEFEKQRIDLCKRFAFSNNPHKIGDIITDHIGSIKIQQIKTTFGYLDKYPSCIYIGQELKKDLTPIKKESIRQVSQNNIKK